MTALDLSIAMEQALVARNLRGMAQLQPALQAGYCLRAASVLKTSSRVIIGTGFPVEETFETDGPLGAIALYHALSLLGIDCYIACAAPLAVALQNDYQILELKAFNTATGESEARQRLAALKPDTVVSIERPGLADDLRYYNMRGEDISPRCAVFDYYLTLADCPTIAIGDGGNEIGMGKLREQVAALSIKGAATSCDELLVADVSNWGAYALICQLEALTGEALLATVDHKGMLAYLSERGSVDGVTRENTLTEDGLPAAAGETLIHTLQALLAQFHSEEGKQGERK